VEQFRLHHSSRLVETDWLASRLRPFGLGVASVVPDGFPAYTRILHPARGINDEQIRWADVAVKSGSTMHRLAQFHAISRPPVAVSDVAVGPPEGLGVDEIFTRTDSAGTRDFLTDALGPAVALTDSSGTVQTQYTYEPFGKTTSTGQTNTSNFQYTGRENDATGLYFNRARYYNPTLQRFISEDPVGFGGGDTDFYTYAGDSPTNLIDPFSLDSTNWFNVSEGRIEA
jgi:RHS repeat-associated protein